MANKTNPALLIMKRNWRQTWILMNKGTLSGEEDGKGTQKEVNL